MKPGDLIFCRDEKFGHHRLWEVQGCHYGGEKTESLIALKCLSDKPGWAEGQTHETTFVPECLLRNVEILTHWTRDAHEQQLREQQALIRERDEALKRVKLFESLLAGADSAVS